MKSHTKKHDKRSTLIPSAGLITCAALAIASYSLGNDAISSLPTAYVSGTDTAEVSAEAPLQIVQTSRLGFADFLLKLDQLTTESSIEQDHLSSQLAKSYQTYQSTAELSKHGLAVPMRVKAAQVEFQNHRDRLIAHSQYRQLLSSLNRIVDRQDYDIQQQDEGENVAPHFHFRIPGLSLRVGEHDYFTGHLKAQPETAARLIDYTSAKAFASSQVPHRQAIQDYLEHRKADLDALVVQYPVERQNINYYLTKIKIAQEAGQQNYLRNKRNKHHLNDFLKFTEDPSREAVEFPETSENIWLLGDGAAKPRTTISPEGVESARLLSQSASDSELASVRLNAAQNKLQRVTRLRQTGDTSLTELSNATLEHRLAQIALEKAKLQDHISSLSHAVLATAAEEQTAWTQTARLPHELSAESWQSLLHAGPAKDLAQILDFLDIAHANFASGAATQSSKRIFELSSESRDIYASLPNQMPIERETQRANFIQARADYLTAHTVQQCTLLDATAWVAASPESDTAIQQLATETLDQIILASQAMLEARMTIATLDYDAKSAVYDHHLAHLDRLIDLHQAGKLRRFELDTGYQQAKAHRGAAESAHWQATLVQKEAEAFDSLLEHRCLDYDQTYGMRVTHLPQPVIDRLADLAAHREGSDPGKITELEARHTIISNRIDQVSQLALEGYASNEEYRMETMMLLQVENLLATELGKDLVADAASDVVRSLRFDREVEFQSSPVLVRLSKPDEEED